MTCIQSSTQLLRLWTYIGWKDQCISVCPVYTTELSCISKATICCILVFHQVLFQTPSGQVAITIMPFFIKEMISIKKQLVVSNFLHCEAQPFKELNDICYVHITVSSLSSFQWKHSPVLGWTPPRMVSMLGMKKGSKGSQKEMTVSCFTVEQ